SAIGGVSAGGAGWGPCVVRLVNIGKNFSHCNKRFGGDFAVDLDGGEHLGKVPVLAHLDAILESKFRNLQGQLAVARGDDFGQNPLVYSIFLEGDGGGAAAFFRVLRGGI